MKESSISRLSPPWWVRAVLYTAYWPGDHRDFRIGLQRKYLRDVKRIGKKGANRRARERGIQFAQSSALRFLRVGVVLAKLGAALSKLVAAQIVR